MFEKIRIKNQIKKLKKEITLNERKRARSQAALIEAILQNTSPSDDDVDFFNYYTEQINNSREKISNLQSKIDKNKK
ncbi:MAG: hypothetical protein PHD46_05215 [Eubacteriales bacterium]|nr:hypothetical protein [Eubacteriales bacterium]MDD4422416.1 hypothetical protein [Eubacteriales bacterium]HBR31138.1 hypothetical protein [Clostridiales bacterium]